MTLYLDRQGQGPDLVLVHGWGLHGGIWGELAGRLAAHYRVTTVDLPGHGRSRVLPGSLDLAGVTDFVVERVPSPATWIGWSLGGLLALQAAARHPPRVAKLVLVGTTPCFVRAPGWRHGMNPETLTQFALELARDYRATLQRFLSLQVGMDAAGRALLRTLRNVMFEHGEPDAQALIAGLNILRDTDMRPMLAQIACPVLIVHGDLDRLASAGAADYLQAQLPQARLARIEHAGHAPFLSHAERFHELLREFL